MLYIHRSDGVVGKVLPAEDSCDVFQSGGKFYQFGDRANPPYYDSNEAFYKHFGTSIEELPHYQTSIGILALCIGYGIFDYFAYREEIAVNGAVYARSRENVSEIPEGSVELGYLRSILHRNIGSPSVDFSGTNLDEKYGGCGLYQDPENEMVIYLEDYSGFYIPFVLKEYIVQPETP